MDSLLWCLDILVNNPIANTERVEVQLNSLSCSVGNQLVLIVEVVIEGRSIMSAITLGPEVECLRGDVRINLWESTQETLQDMPCCNC